MEKEELRRLSRAQWIRRDVPLFLLVGASVGIAGHQVLLALLALGVLPAVANTVQAVVTLQLNFIGNSLLTWRRRTTGSEVPVRVRWLRFQVARLASLLLSVAVFPVLAPLIGTSPAYWSLLVAGAAANFCLDRYWSFRPDRRRPEHAGVGLARPADPRWVVAGCSHTDPTSRSLKPPNPRQPSASSSAPTDSAMSTAAGGPSRSAAATRLGGCGPKTSVRVRSSTSWARAASGPG